MKKGQIVRNLILTLALGALSFEQCAGSELGSSVIYWSPRALQKKSPPDVVIQGDFGTSSQNFILEQVRIFLAKKLGLDIYEHRIKQDLPIHIPLKVKDETDIVVLINDFLDQNFLGNGVADATIRNLSYRINPKETALEISLNSLDSKGLHCNLKVNINEIDAQADFIGLKFRSCAEGKELKTCEGAKSSFIDHIGLSVHSPQIYSQSKKTLEIDIDFLIQYSDSNQMKIEIEKTEVKTFRNDFEDELEKSLSLSWPIETPPQIIGLKGVIFGGDIPLDNEGLATVLELRKKNVAEFLLRPVADLLKNLPQKIMETGKMNLPVLPPMQIGLNNKKKEQKSLQLEFRHSNIAILKDHDQQDRQFFVGFDFDLNQSEAVYPPNKIQKFKNSIETMYRSIEDGEQELIVSVSDVALAMLARTILEDPFVKSKLPKGIRLGESGINWELNQQSGEQGKIVIDFEYERDDILRPLMQLLLGKPLIHVPLVLRPKVSTAFNKSCQCPEIVIELADYDFDSIIQRSGHYLDNGQFIDSNFEQLRLKKLIRAIIKKRLAKLIGRPLAKIPIKQLKGIDLSIVKARSDENGRLMLGLKLNPYESLAAERFWQVMQELPIQNKIKQKEKKSEIQ